MFQKQYNRISQFYKLIVRNRGVVDVVNVYDKSYYAVWLCEDGSVLFRDPKNDTISEFLSGKYVLYDKNFCRIDPAFVPIITEETV